MKENEIRVPVNNGYLVAKRNTDPNYDGIHIVFETKDGVSIDIASVECKLKTDKKKLETDKKKIDIYTYANVYGEDFISKNLIKVDEIQKMLVEKGEK